MLSKKKKPFKVFCQNSNRETVGNPAYEAIFGYNDIFIALNSDFYKINLADLRMYYIHTDFQKRGGKAEIVLASQTIFKHLKQKYWFFYKLLFQFVKKTYII